MNGLVKTAAAAAMGASTLFAAASSSAQTDTLSKASTEFYATCIAKQGATSSECACVTGYFAGIMKEDEFQIMNAIMPHIDASGDVDDLDAAVAVAVARQKQLGMTDARFQEVMQLFAGLEEKGKHGDRVCLPLAGK